MTDDSRNFPAAHSMDTAWFAVDRDGHVALFETGESGAVPTEGYLGEEHWDLIAQVRATVPRREAVHDVEAWKATATTPHVELPPPMEAPAVLTFVASLDGLDDLLRGVKREQVKATSGVGLVLHDARPVLAALHERGACLGCFVYFEEREEEETSLAEHGLYPYEHTCENWIAGPYALHRRPTTPVSIGSLPAAVQARAVRFDGRFAETPRLQPALLWNCESWEPAWLADDMKTVHPFPGRDAEYAEARAQMSENPALVFVDGVMTPAAQATGATKPWWKLW